MPIRPRFTGTRADWHLQPILLRGGVDRPRTSRNSPQRRDPGRTARRQGGLARPVSFHRGFGETPLRQRNPHHQVLPPPLEGGTAKAFPSTHLFLLSQKVAREARPDSGKGRDSDISRWGLICLLYTSDAAD